MATTDRRIPRAPVGQRGYGMAEATSDSASRADQVHPWVADASRAVRFGIVGGPSGDWPALRDFVQMTEDLGFDSFWRPDHPLLLQDCWTTLAAVATVTRRLRLGSLVGCVFYRNPVLLARTVADVDRISQGRVVLGLGAGDIEAEFQAMGLAYPPVRERQEALAEALAVVPRLLRGEAVAYRGAYCRVDGAALQPPPVQQPYVPLLVGGGGERTTLRLVARYADASSLGAGSWGGGAATDADVQHKYIVLREHCATVGRPYTSVLRTYHLFPVLLADSPAALAAKRERVPRELFALAGAAALVGTPEQVLERLRPLVAAGCQYFTLAVLEPDTLRLLAERVVPAVAGPASTVPVPASQRTI
jgi:alkanesulfonate monooxygenase SsuD/methylene tetrahydromethanopterin reductase-like flavin-dependent oxidoreductase (luciferase family)